MSVEQSQHYKVDWNQISTPLSPLEKLPNEIFGNILSCLPDLVGGVGAVGISAVIGCKKQLEITSKKIYLTVNSPCCAFLFMQAIRRKYVEPEKNFPYSELTILKEGVWDRVQSGSIHCSFEETQEKVWAPLEALPDEILRKIIISLTKVRGEGSAQAATQRESHVELQRKEMQKTICSQINLGLTSKRLHKVVHDGYTKRRFIYAIIDKYQMLDFGLFVREVVAVREGVEDYMHTHQLKKSTELIPRVQQLVSNLVKVANQRLKECEVGRFKCYLYDALPLGFEIHAHPGSMTFDVFPNMVRIYCPFDTLVVWLDRNREASTTKVVSASLILFDLVRSLIECFDATFLGIRSPSTYGLNRFSSWPDSGYYEISSTSPNLGLVNGISPEEVHSMTRSSVWKRRGSGSFFVCLNSNFRTVYQVRSLFGESVPTCGGIDGFRTSPELIRLANLVRLMMERERTHSATKSDSCAFEKEEPWNANRIN